MIGACFKEWECQEKSPKDKEETYSGARESGLVADRVPMLKCCTGGGEIIPH